jgi:hypothetical protein
MFHSLFQRIVVAGIGVAAGLALFGGAALAWGERVEGMPTSFQAGAADGYYIWHDGGGWHVRTTDSSGVFVYSGTLRTDGTFDDVALAQPEGADQVQLLDGGHALQFQLRTHEHIDGVDFRVDGGTGVVFHLEQNGQPISTSSIFLGQSNVNPVHDPFEVDR